MNNNRHLYIYGHAGSRNHGNEAIVRGFSRIFEEYAITVCSYDPEADKKWGLEEICTIEHLLEYLKKYSLVNLLGHLEARWRGTDYIRRYFWYRKFLKQLNGICILEAGDQYCESREIVSRYAFLNRQIKKKGYPTIAYGMSINTQVLEDKRVIKDLSNYDQIVVRESLSYNALKNKGIKQIELIPDAAFAMIPKPCDLPDIFEKDKVVGITFGYLAQGKEKYFNNLKKCVEALIAYILQYTDFSIALIPHVNIGRTLNDIEPLKELTTAFSSERIQMVEEHRADEQKFIISRCRFLITLRTHASIAAYSSLVPTLVLGYSIKSKGIAKDLFGTYENYVRKIEDLVKEESLIESFIWLQEREDTIRKTLSEKMPVYIRKAYDGKEKLEELF